MPRLRFSLRTLLVAVTLIAIGFAGERYYQQLYASNYPGYHVLAVLNGIQNGNAFDDVARQFKSAERLNATDDSVKKLSLTRTGLIHEGDEFWRFRDSSGRMGALFQFRDGLVINHQPSDFADPVRLAAMNRFRIPPIILRFGFWPIYVVAVGVATTMFIFVRKVVARWQKKSPAAS